jgi:hypothetical protein
MESHYVHTQHHVSVLMYHIVCAATYRRVVMSPRVDEVLKEVCLEIAKRMGDLVLGDWSGSRSRAFSGAIRSDVKRDENCANGEERDGAGGVCQSPGGEKETVGRGVLGKGQAQFRF